ncbi:MAG: hypothetical protein A2Z14_13180 [Chloroflexi bacterium RBG_16_48_8]|nr:MAG: hypothetical protein A2Z14_13180 [Chloroflexi bacterium RBG_16_48_8]
MQPRFHSPAYTEREDFRKGAQEITSLVQKLVPHGPTSRGWKAVVNSLIDLAESVNIAVIFRHFFGSFDSVLALFLQYSHFALVDSDTEDCDGRKG